MRSSRILLLLVALLAGGLAAFLATRGSDTAPVQQATVEIQQEQRTQILIATRPIGVGERLSEASVDWQDWPQGAVRPEYVAIATSPEAKTDIVGAVARFEFFTGEPIREQKLVRTDQGYLSAVLSEGMRGVSIGVSAESAAGGFVIPNDHVDVVLTRDTGAGKVSETIVSNVKVLAIGKRLGEVGAPAGNPDTIDPQAQVFEAETIATLELDPYQAETVINARTDGKLSLALRSVVDFGKDATGVDVRRDQQAISVIRFGKQASVQSGATQPMAPLVVAPPEPEPAIAETAPEPAAPPVEPLQ